MPPRLINADKPHLWKRDIAASVDQFNEWFMSFAPQAFRSTRTKTTEQVRQSLLKTDDLRKLTPDTLRSSPEVLSTLRMCTAPPIAVDRLIGLAKANNGLVKKMDDGKLSLRMKPEVLNKNLESICRVLSRLLDNDIFPWLSTAKGPLTLERERAASIIADRLCSAVANPIVRNAQERRQLELIGEFLEHRGYRKQIPPTGKSLCDMEPGTYWFRVNCLVGKTHKVNIPIDVVIQPLARKKKHFPLLIEAKSAGDFTNTNKRRKEEAVKVHQLRNTYGENVRFVLFLCGYFGSDYLGYEAAEGIDWIWEHRIDDLIKLGI